MTTTQSTEQPAGSILTKWEIRTYDVWGNRKDGFEVNDVFKRGTEEIVIECHRYNVGTPSEFVSASPTDAQIKRIFGLGKTQIDTDGDDLTVYVTRTRDSYPIGEMFCISHASLSPVQEKQDVIPMTPAQAADAIEVQR